MISTEASSRWRLLIAGEDASYREWLRHHLEVLCQDATISAVSLTALLQRTAPVTQAECDIILVTACFGAGPEDPRAAGLQWLQQIALAAPLPAIIAVAEEGNELTAVRAIQLGAAEYLPKRLLTPERLQAAIQAALRRLAVQVLAPPDPRAPMPATQAPAADEPPPLSAEAVLELLAAPAAPPEAPDTPGLELAAGLGFTVEKRLSDAQTSSVYLAASKRWGAVAFKVSRTPQGQPASRELMERAYAPIMAIRNPSVVTIHDLGVHEDGPASLEYLVMQYLPRGNLRTRLQQPLTGAEILHYAQAIAASLEVIHGAGVLHRDLKPANVMLREDDGIALIDFERTHTVDGSRAAGGVLRGSPYYMSPEHALGEPLDERADFYSLGVILYEMLTGKRPYTGASAREVLQAHVSAPVPELPPEQSRFDELLARLLAKDRNERFASAAEISAALTQVQTGVTLLDMDL